MSWRLILDGPRDGASNMALDEALLQGVQAGGRPVLRLYRWVPACLSFGRNQVAAGIYDVKAAVGLAIDIVRRPTGGLAVYHDRELTYSVVVPAGLLGGPRATYAAINGALADGLRSLGAAVDTMGMGTPANAPAGSLSVSGTSTGPGLGGAASPAARNPCFHQAATGEVVANGRKLVGSAVRLEKRTILQHGSILLDGDQSAVTRLQHRPADAYERLAGRASVGLCQILGRTPAWDELYRTITVAFEKHFRIVLESGSFSGSELGRARVLEDHYRSDAWTWRR